MDFFIVFNFFELASRQGVKLAKVALFLEYTNDKTYLSALMQQTAILIVFKELLNKKEKNTRKLFMILIVARSGSNKR